MFEGCDRVGKSTQCKRLVEALNAAGKKCKRLNFPGKDVARELEEVSRDRSVSGPDHFPVIQSDGLARFSCTGFVCAAARWQPNQIVAVTVCDLL